MRKVLVVAYIFPPTATTGVHRTAKFAKYLPKFGWQSIVLTTGNPAYEGMDFSLMNDLPEELKVIRVKSFERAHVRRLAYRMLRCLHLESRLGAAFDWRLGSLFHAREIPDEHATWARKVIPVALKLVREHAVDVIYTTSWPYSDHLVGMEVARQTGLPWVADFRDPWLANSSYLRDPESDIGIQEAHLERQFVEKASVVIGTTNHMLETFRASYPGVAADKFRLVRNGYDPENIPDQQMPSTAGPLRLGHVGAFYRQRSPKSLLLALQTLQSEGITPKELHITFVGAMGGTEKLIEQYGLTEFCRVLGPQPLAVCYQSVANCHVLWLLNQHCDDFAVPGKTYEYLATGKWILGSLSFGSETGQLIAKAGEGVTFVEPDDVDEMTTALRDLLIRHKGSVLTCCRDAEYVKQFSRQRQASLLADILNEVSEESTN